MYRRFHDRFGTAGIVIGVIALVLALVTGAYAAGGGLSAKQKKEVKAIAKSFQGTGPTGPQGAPGAPGANGKDGTNGSNGTNGTAGSDGADGQSVTVTEEPAFGECGDVSGYKLDSVSGEDYVCNGEDGTNGTNGSPWTAGGTLPSGSTETGTWFVGGTEGNLVTSSISFTIPLAAALNETHVHFYAEAGFATTCTGSAATPTAPSGHLCVYKGEAEGIGFEAGLLPASPLTETKGAAKAGAAVVGFVTEGVGIAKGTWAVTG